MCIICPRISTCCVYISVPIPMLRGTAYGAIGILILTIVARRQNPLAPWFTLGIERHGNATANVHTFPQGDLPGHATPSGGGVPPDFSPSSRNWTWAIP